MRRIAWLAPVVLLTLAPAVLAGTITSSGAVDALTDISQMASIYGSAPFEVTGASTEVVPLGLYSASGLTFRTGALSSILSGVTSSGSASTPQASTTFSGPSYFPTPIAGGGTNTGQANFLGGVGTFSTPVTQAGVTISRNGTQYLTAWDSSGALIGQVKWVPTSDSSFFGLDSRGVPIAMIALGNDDVYGGVSYSIGGSTIISDDWVWGPGAVVPEPGTFALFGAGLLGLAGLVRRRRRKAVRGHGAG